MKIPMLAIAVAACGHTPTSAPVVVAPTTVPQARATYDLPGDGNGAYWDGTALYVTDDTHDQIVRWTDADGWKPAGALVPADKPGLGGLVRMADGTFVVAAFGFGTDGGVVTLAGATAAHVPGLDPVRRRIGIARAPDDSLFDAYFVVEPNHHHAGGVARLDLAGKETDLPIEGLGKVVGIAANPTTIFIGDQERGEILAYDLATTKTRTFATGLPGVDLLTILPGGDLVTGGKTGVVSRIDHRDGHVSQIAAGFEQVRGTAYDATRGRLFVVEHGKTTHRLHVIPDVAP